MGGAVPAVEGGYMKSELVASHSRRRRRIEAGEDVVVGVNRFETTEPNPLTADLETAIQGVDAGVEAAAVAAVRRWREERDADPERKERAASALARLVADAGTDTNLMPATLECARAGLTTGEWAGALRAVFGEFRAPTGVSGSVGVGAGVRGAGRRAGDGGPHQRRARASGCGCSWASPGSTATPTAPSRSPSGRATPGFEVVYQGIRLTPEQIVGAAVAEDVHLVGISILSGSHMELVPEVLERMREAGAGDVPVIVGGIIPEADAVRLKALGVAEVFTPKDFGLNDIMVRFVEVIRASRGLAADAATPAHA